MAAIRFVITLCFLAHCSVLVGLERCSDLVGLERCSDLVIRADIVSQRGC